MKLKYTFAINEVAGQTIAVPVDCEYGEQSIIKTNETGAYILELLKTNTTLQDILINIKNNFEVEDQELLETWVASFIGTLESAGVLEDE